MHNTGSMPSLLKIALITPIFKITFPTSDNYRPTSIIPTFSKVINLHNGNMPRGRSRFKCIDYVSDLAWSCVSEITVNQEVFQVPYGCYPHAPPPRPKTFIKMNESKWQSCQIYQIYQEMNFMKVHPQHQSYSNTILCEYKFRTEVPPNVLNLVFK